LMGGRIEVESEKNKGSTFSFSIWVGLSEEEAQLPAQEFVEMPMMGTSSEEEDVEDIRQYGTPENKKSLKNNLSKLILCVEMENWEKAEMFMETIRQMTQGAPREVSRGILRLKMAVQKANYEKTAAQYKELEALLEDDAVTGK